MQFTKLYEAVGAHTAAIAITLALVAVIAAIFAVVRLMLMKDDVDRKISSLMRKTSQQAMDRRPEATPQDEAKAQMTAVEGMLDSLARDARAMNDVTRRTVSDIVRVLADQHSREVQRSEQEGGGERVSLLSVYETARTELSAVTSSLAGVTASVSSLGACCSGISQLDTVGRALVQNFLQMQGADSELAAKIARIKGAGHSSAEVFEQIRASFDAGTLSPEAYLQQVMSIQGAERITLPDLNAERTHYRELAAQSTDGFLVWLDRINDLRDLALETGNHEIASACTQIIRQSRPALERLDIEIEDVEIGRTQYDARLHDLVHTMPGLGMRPETVIGVRKLGYRRNGKTVRKPQVVVAAAGN